MTVSSSKATTPRIPSAEPRVTTPRIPSVDPRVTTPRVLSAEPRVRGILSRLQDRILDLSNVSAELSRFLKDNGMELGDALRLPNMTNPFSPVPSVATPRKSRPNEALAPIPKHREDIKFPSERPEEKDKDLQSKGDDEVSIFSAWSLSSPTALRELKEEINAPVALDPKKSISSDLYRKEFRLKDAWNDYSEASIDAGNLDLAQRSAKRSKSTDEEKLARTDTAAFSLADSGISVPQIKGVSRYFVYSPASPSRVFWECASIAMILYDVVAIPLSIAFHPPESLFFDVADWTQRMFWTLNIPMVLTTGFISKGMVVMQPGSILLHYLKTWFVVDAITVFPDWVFVFMNAYIDDENSDASGLVKTLRIMRVFRVARLLRMGKLRDAWVMLYDMIDSEKFGLLLDVFKNILMLMLIIHYIAAAWFAVGEAQIGISWLKYHNFEREEVGWGHQYLVSYHWCLTQIASTMHVQPQSVSERIFAIFVVILGLIGFSYFVGSITGSLARLRAIEERRTANFWFLRKFLKRHHIPHELAVRIRTYCEGRYAHQQMSLDISEVESLSLLSDKLKAELACAIHGPALCIHPLFGQLHIDCETTVQRLALHLTHVSMAPKDVMFTAGEEATHMSVPTSGNLQYDRVEGNCSFPETVVPREDWIAEPALWVNDWVHLGILKSTTAAELILVRHETMYQVSSINPVAFFAVSSYARDYVKWLNEFERAFLSDITQSQCEGLKVAEFVRVRNSARAYGSTSLKLFSSGHDRTSKGSTLGLMDFVTSIAKRKSTASLGERKSTASMSSSNATRSGNLQHF